MVSPFSNVELSCGPSQFKEPRLALRCARSPGQRVGFALDSGLRLNRAWFQPDGGCRLYAFPYFLRDLYSRQRFMGFWQIRLADRQP